MQISMDGWHQTPLHNVTHTAFRSTWLWWQGVEIQWTHIQRSRDWWNWVLVLMKMKMQQHPEKSLCLFYTAEDGNRLANLGRASLLGEQSQATVYLGGTHCGWYSEYILLTSTHRPGRLATLSWVWGTGILDTAMFMSTVHTHSGGHLFHTSPPFFFLNCSWSSSTSNPALCSVQNQQRKKENASFSGLAYSGHPDQKQNKLENQWIPPLQHAALKAACQSHTSKAARTHICRCSKI